MSRPRSDNTVGDLDVLVDVSPSVEESVDTSVFEPAVSAALSEAHSEGRVPVHSCLTVSIRLCGDAEMHELNRTYRGVDHPTDVLSFSFIEKGGPEIRLPDDMPLELGEVVLDVPYATRQAIDLGHPAAMELAWLTIHGTLQLVGYHHAGEDEARHMERLEHRALTALGFDLDA